MDKKIIKCVLPIEKVRFDDFCDALFKSIKSWETLYNVTTREIRFGKDTVTLFYIYN